MFKQILLTSAIAVFLIGCAQVQSLSGGPKDDIAPQIVDLKPHNETVFFNFNSIEFTFDEFVKLDNPLQNITLVPNHSPIKAQLKDKKLSLTFEKELKENTTYSIFLNRAVKDIHEGKDSIMQYVFSTGEVIDSLQYNCYLVDAVNNQPVNGATVGLFEHPDSLRPLYFTQSDQGKVQFKYLKQGSFYLRAFDDANRDGKIGKTEKMAFHVEPITIPQGEDTVTLRFFQPELPADITTFQYEKPGTFLVGANRPLLTKNILFNGQELDTTKMRYFKYDSLAIYDFGIANESNRLKITGEWEDSSRVRVPTTKQKTFKLTEGAKELTSEDTLQITTTGFIYSIDTTKIKWINTADTSIIEFEYIIDRNKVYFMPKTNYLKSKLEIAIGAVNVDPDWKSLPLNVNIVKLAQNEVGILNINTSYYQTPIILDVIKANKVVQTFYLDKVKNVQLKDLIPGEYTFKIILDNNNNRRWDTGNFETLTQPEQIEMYSTPVKVRGNWEMDVLLEPTKIDE